MLGIIYELGKEALLFFGSPEVKLLDFLTQTTWQPSIGKFGGLPLVNAGSPFDSLPLASPLIENVFKKNNFVLVSTATAVANNYQDLWWNANEDG